MPDLAVPIVPQFAPRLVLAHVEQLSTTTDWNCAVADANGQTLAVLPPLTAEFARLLEENAGHGQLKLQSIQVEDQFMANNRIRVELVFTDGPLTWPAVLGTHRNRSSLRITSPTSPCGRM